MKTGLTAEVKWNSFLKRLGSMFLDVEMWSDWIFTGIVNVIPYPPLVLQSAGAALDATLAFHEASAADDGAENFSITCRMNFQLKIPPVHLKCV